MIIPKIIKFYGLSLCYSDFAVIFIYKREDDEDDDDCDEESVDFGVLLANNNNKENEAPASNSLTKSLKNDDNFENYMSQVY